MRQSINWLTISLALVLIVAAGVCPQNSAAAQEQGMQVRITQVDTSEFPAVTVYVSVTDESGGPLMVDPNQIQLFESDVLVQPEAVSSSGEIGRLTTMLVMDISGSMNEVGKLEAAKAAAQAYVDQMRPGDLAGLLTFNTQVEVVSSLTEDRQALAQAILSLQADGDTAMYDALFQAIRTIQEAVGRKAIIVLTDGMDNVSQMTQDQVIQAIGPGGLSISTIGLGNPDQLGILSGLDEDSLRTLAQEAGGIYSYADDSASLRSLYERYGRTLQSEYCITYTSPSTLRDGITRALTVSLAGQASARAEYNPGGVLPEVIQKVSWPIFGGFLGVLVLLLVLPLVVQALRRPKQRRRVKLSPPSSRPKPLIKLN